MRCETLRSSRTSSLRRGEALASTTMRILQRADALGKTMSPLSAFYNFYNLPWRVGRGYVSSGNKHGSKLPRQLARQQAASHYPSIALRRWEAQYITSCYQVLLPISDF